ncbi:MAG: hypothetical protein R2883_01360 [Caldisericia bacterium]
MLMNVYSNYLLAAITQQKDLQKLETKVIQKTEATALDNYQLLIETSPFSIIYFSESGKINEINHVGHELISDFIESDKVGIDYLPKEIFANFSKYFGLCDDISEIISRTETITLGDGEVRYIRFYLRLLPGRDIKSIC